MRPPDVVPGDSAVVGFVGGSGKWRWLDLPSCITDTCSVALVAVLSAVDTLAGALVMLRPEGMAMTLFLDTDVDSLEDALTCAELVCDGRLLSVAVPFLAGFSLCCTGTTVKPMLRWSFCRMLCGLVLEAEG